ncbi:MAG: CRISPR-associated protein [Bacteroidetes bacterium]|nr:MAG: CRISPR-associated protein [Bacteroidota bacterium]
MGFNNRVFGCVVVKSINSNYNADFSHQPRTLPDGTVYATDKALKYAIKNYLKDMYEDERIFYFKRFDPDFKPLSLDEAYAAMFPDHAEEKNKSIVATDILSCLDIRLFGATFAKKGRAKDSNVAISIHGPVQINHGVNVWHENNIYSEQIMSPFRNPKAKDEEEGKSDASTLGRQSKLQEGHYLHHFSINPANLRDVLEKAGEGARGLSDADIAKFKEAICKGVTYYDSAAKAGTDNELTIWIQLKEGSKIVFPNINSLITIDKLTKENGKMVFDLSEVSALVNKYAGEVEKYEVYYQKENTIVKNGPEPEHHFDLN